MDFPKDPMDFHFMGVRGGFSYKGGANYVLDCRRIELNVGFVRVGLSCALPLGMQIRIIMLILRFILIISPSLLILRGRLIICLW